MYAPLSRLLIRAPLLPARELPRANRALKVHPLGQDAIALASPSLAVAAPGPARTQALERYARRAAFRATPSGLLAGVCLGTLGPRAEVATGTPGAWLAPSWQRMDSLARALLDDPAVRGRVSVRVAPSLLSAPGEIRWIGPGEPFGELRVAAVDERLAAILEAAAGWTPWERVRDAGSFDDQDGDEFLLTLVDGALLQTELAPPLVGLPAAAHLLGRLRALGLDSAREGLEAALAALGAGDRQAGQTALDRLPGHAARAIQAVLVHRPKRTPRIPRAVVTRAARLVPLLIRLQEALAPPAAERLQSAALAEALDAVTETHGAGAFDIEGLATGQYGVEIDEDEPPNPPPAAANVVAFLANAIACTSRAGSAEVALDAAALAGALGEASGAPLPRTAELFLMPVPTIRAQPAGTGWLLGLHGPAGASLGRFAHALGPPLADALAEIASAEMQAGDGERLDVAFTPAPSLADLCAQPAVRPRALAITRWTGGADDLTLSDLAVVADPAHPDGLALRHRDRPETELVPSPLWRVRSSTAPAGAARLAVGWTLLRQHAPWALTLGPLGALEALPRMTLEGFVIAPASWRVPDDLRQHRTARAGRAALQRWRRAARLPRHVQIGEGDELAPVDLEAASAPRELAAVDRVHEIWPPLGQTIDRDGRRLELVVPVVQTAAAEREAKRLALQPLARVAPPREAPPLAGWRTFKLFGPPELQDGLLVELVGGLVEDGLAAGEITAWFFLRYEDGPGRRPHLRLRVRGSDQGAAVEARLRAALDEARAAGALTSLETGDYFPERGRFRAEELDGLHAVFQADSQAVLALLADGEADPIVTRVRLFDALAAGFGLNGAAREELARERRGVENDEEKRRAADAGFRQYARALRSALGGDQDGAADPVAEMRERIAGAAKSFHEGRRGKLLRAVLHLSSVRLAGADPDGERLGYTFWHRAREGLRRAPVRR